jgi:hypothetical protein
MNHLMAQENTPMSVCSANAVETGPIGTEPQKKLLTMSTLGSHGLGNQIFQYGFLKIYARRNNLRVETSQWLGTHLFGHTDPPVSRQLPEIYFDSDSPDNVIIEHLDSVMHDVDIRGFFQFHTRFYAPDKSYFRSLFQPISVLTSRFNVAYENLRARGKTVIGIHIRRGDYAYVSHRYLYIAPSKWYHEWLRGFWDTLEKPVLFIASDEPENVLADFADYNPVTYIDLDPTLTPENFCAGFYVDFYMLSRCDAVAISNSTFSHAACMLNETGTIFARPHLPSRKLVPFDPWNSEVLLRDET